MDVWFGKDRSHVSWEHSSVYWRGEEACKQAEQNDIFCPCVDCENKIVWPDPKVIQSHLIKIGFKRNCTLRTKHGEIDDTLHEVDTEVGDNNSDGVFDRDNLDAADDDDDFDYQKLMRHVEP
jgi:hypothetical protein